MKKWCDMRLYPLNKTVFSFQNNVDQFFNGLTSNTLDLPRNAFVNLHGRIVATFDQLRISDSECVVIVESFAVDVIFKHIQKFLTLNKTTARRLDLRVFWDLDNAYSPGRDEFVIAQKAGKIILTVKELEAGVSPNDFTLFRVRNGIALFGVDYQPDEFLLNVDEHEFVSYTKGCFLGQEPIAKVHNRSRPSWTLKVCRADDLSVSLRGQGTSRVFDPEANVEKYFGFVSNKPGL